jgi:hypothetical protein
MVLIRESQNYPFLTILPFIALLPQMQTPPTGLSWDEANSIIGPPLPAVHKAAPPIAAPSTIMVLSLLIFDGVDGFNNGPGMVVVYVVSVLLVVVVYGIVWACTLRLLPWGDTRALCRYVVNSLDVREWLRAGRGGNGGAEEGYTTVPNANSAEDENEEVRGGRGGRGSLLCNTLQLFALRRTDIPATSPLFLPLL